MHIDVTHGAISASPKEVNVEVLEDEVSKIDLVVEVSSDGETKGELCKADEVLTKRELDLAYAAEKLVNLSILMMHIDAKESHFEAFASGGGRQSSSELAEEVLELDLLLGFVESEVKEMENHLSTLQMSIVGVAGVISSNKPMGETVMALEENLHDLEKSLKQSQDQVSDIMVQSAKFRRALSRIRREDGWNNEGRSTLVEFDQVHVKIDMQSAEQQKHILRMLEKSLAKETELDSKLCESENSEEETRRRLLSVEQELCFVEEEAIDTYRWWLDRENAAELLLGISRELLDRLQLLQFNLNGSMLREAQLKEKLEDLSINYLKEKLSQAESRAEVAETKFKSLTNTYKDLSEELSLCKTASEKVELLEKQLQESDMRRQHAVASAEASQEKQTMLYSTIRDMETLIADLKTKVLNAENRADSAEDKCIILSEYNAEITKEVSFLRSKVERVEASLNRTEKTKSAVAKDISFRSKVLADLIMQLTLERERLDEQIQMLALENRTLSVKLQQMGMDLAATITHHHKRKSEDHVMTSAIKMDETQTVASLDERTGTDFDAKLETVRRVDAGVLEFKHVIVAVLVLLISGAAYLFHPQNQSL